jgi:hypothetical protein
VGAAGSTGTAVAAMTAAVGAGLERQQLCHIVFHAVIFEHDYLLLDCNKD